MTASVSRIRLPKKAGPRVAIGQALPDGATERDLEDLVLLHLGVLPWCRFWRNKERHVSLPDGRTDYTPGLAKGSADLVGIVRLDASDATVGVFTAIELKQPGSGKKPRADQCEWMSVVRRMGGVAEWTDSLFGALRIVAYARCTDVGQVVNEIAVLSGKTVLA